MADLEAIVRARFAAVVAPAPLRPGVLAPRDPRPAVVFHVLDTVEDAAGDGSPDYCPFARVQFDCSAYEPDNAQALRRAIKAAVRADQEQLATAVPLTWGGARVHDCRLENSNRSQTAAAGDGSGRTIHTRQLDLLVNFAEVV